MAGLEKKDLDYLKRNWKHTDLSIVSQNNRAWSDLYSIRHKFEEAGYDMNDDATYGLLEKGLTKDKFDMTFTHSVVIQTLYDYYNTLTPDRNDYVDSFNSRRMYGLGRLIDTMIPMLEENLDNTGLPPLSALESKQLSLLLDLYKDGTLEDEMKQSALKAAHDSFRGILTYTKQVKNQDPDDQNIRPTREGLSYADRCLEQIDKAGSYYKEENIPAEYGSFGGWDKDAGTVKFSKEEIEKARKMFLLKELSMEFSLAKKFQEKGHFVLDASGSGHGMMVMPMQDILKKLKDYKYDITDPKTYEGLQTDKKTFKACYEKERKNVLKDDKYNLIKPKFKL